MYESWTCLSVERGPGMLSTPVRNELCRVACALNKKKRDRINFVSDVCEGLMVTEWKTVLLGGRAGILFRAQLDTEDGGYKVNFLLHDRDLQIYGDRMFPKDFDDDPQFDGWVDLRGPPPVPELHEFPELRRDRSK